VDFKKFLIFFEVLIFLNKIAGFKRFSGEKSGEKKKKRKVIHRCE